MADSIPDRMHALVLHEYCEDIAEAIDSLKVEQRSVPALKRGQVLVRIEAAPCNPSDLLLLQGKYGSLKTLPTVPGWEGAGTVVASGGGWLAGWLRGKRVACGRTPERNRDLSSLDPAFAKGLTQHAEDERGDLGSDGDRPGQPLALRRLRVIVDRLGAAGREHFRRKAP